MKSILIIGTKEGGKSTTITEVCKMLKPSKVYKLKTTDKKIETADVNDIYNNTFIIEINDKFILVVAGAPTEQSRTLRVLIEICIQINIQISFLLVSKRTSERKKGFNTIKDINDFSELIHTERISPVPLVDKNDINSFKQDLNWKNRITKISKLVTDNI
jgi:hypothetical protein